MLNMMSTAGAIGGQEKMAEPCRPDPEEMLQASRKRIDKIMDDIVMFESMDDYWFPDCENLSLMLYGSMHRALKEAKDTEQYWLSEINKD